MKRPKPSRINAQISSNLRAMNVCRRSPIVFLGARVRLRTGLFADFLRVEMGFERGGAMGDTNFSKRSGYAHER